MMGEQPKPVTGYPATSSQYPSGYPPAQPYASASNGYPQPSYYPPPPPPQPIQAYYYGGAGYRSSPFLRRFIVGMISVFLIIGAILFIIWLIFRPERPDFSVAAITVRPFNVSGSQLTANWNVTITTNNGNKKMGVSYGRIDATIFYKDERLADTSLAPFYQEKHSSTILQAGFAALSAYISDGSKLASERSGGQVYFSIRLWSVVQFKASGWRTRWRTLVVRCNDVEIDWPSSGSNGVEGSSKGPSRCFVYM